MTPEPEPRPVVTDEVTTDAAQYMERTIASWEGYDQEMSPGFLGQLTLDQALLQKGEVSLDVAMRLQEYADRERAYRKERKRDSSADVEAAAQAVSPELAREIRDRAEAGARKRKSALSSDRTKRRIG